MQKASVPADVTHSVFSDSVGPARLSALVEAMVSEDLWGLYLADLVNIRYITGFSGSFARVLVTTDVEIPHLLFTDGRYFEQADQEMTRHGVSQLFQVVPYPEMHAVIAQRHANRPYKAYFGAEEHSLTWAELQEFTRNHSSLNLRPVSDLIRELRRIKSHTEQSMLRHACSIADAALSSVRAILLEEPTERQFARSLENAMYEHGASDISFPTIVASGSRSSMAHAQPTSRQIRSGDVVVVDFGATFEGYHSDCTRTFAVGEPNDLAATLYSVVLKAQELGVTMVKSDRSIAELDQSVRNSLRETNHEQYFTHGLGHGVGLEIHELPNVNGRTEGKLSKGEVITIEPGVYLPAQLGIRIEDTVIVTDDGCEILTKAPKDWIIGPQARSW